MKAKPWTQSAWTEGPRRLAAALTAMALAGLPAAAAAPHHAAHHADPAPAARAKASLPVFEFKGVTAGESVDPNSLGACDQPDKHGEIACRLKDTTVAGLSSETGPIMTFYHGRLTKLRYEFSVHDFIQLEGALQSKYGPSCRTEHPKLQSELGSSLVNLVEAWCFASGDLVLSAMDSSPDTGSLEYLDSGNRAPSGTSRVDF